MGVKIIKDYLQQLKILIIALIISLMLVGPQTVFSQEEFKVEDGVVVDEEGVPVPDDMLLQEEILEEETPAPEPEIIEEESGAQVEQDYDITAQDELEAAFKDEGDTEEQIEDATQKRISLDLKGIDIIQLLRLLSLKTGLTIVPSKNVSGRVNLFLNNVTFDDALDVILITQNLAMERKGDILMIMTDAEYKARFGKSYDENRQIRSYNLTYAKPSSVFDVLSQLKSDVGKLIIDEGSGTVIIIDIPEKLALMEATINDLDKPLETEVFELQYASTADMKTHLDSVITSGTGSALVDEHSNKVVVSDLPGKMSEIKNLVKAFDKEPHEVFIEAEVWQITLRNEFQRGINWERVYDERRTWGLPDMDITGTLPVSPSFTPSPGLDTDNITLTIGQLAIDDYTATLQFLSSYGKIEIISRPKIAVVDNQEASIMVGSREAYITQTQSQGESTTVTSENVEFIDVGIKLNVTPAINEEGIITMTIKPEVSSVRETITTAIGSRVPIVETSEAETTVKIEDGKMIIIGGLLKEENRDDTVGVPILSKLPIVGWLFGSDANLTRNTEIVFLITPHIITGRESMIKEEVMTPLEDITEPKLNKMTKNALQKLKKRAKPREKEVEPLIPEAKKMKIEKAKGLKEFE
jgi:type II secretory pathway component GspD/PulD (secretin)